MSQVSVEKTTAAQIVITVRVPYPELLPLLPKAEANISEETDIEGFRKGHAPYEVVKARIGEFRILEEAARLYINEGFEKILREAAEKEFTGTPFEPGGD